MDGMTKAGFDKSKKPMVFCVSIDPMTGERNWEYLEGYDAGWMRDLIKRDFPERFFFTKLNAAGLKARSIAWFGMDLTSEKKERSLTS